MSVVGLITEYNPFHNGHLYHIEESKKISGADTVVVVMSGDFVQRGSLALIDKYSRTKMALEAGADLVIELPVCYATASAEYFALGAVSILNQLGFVDFLVFGSECGDLSLLTTIANLYENEPDSVKADIQTLMRQGLTYPYARSKALLTYLTHSSISKSVDLESILNSPNNILGIEYLRALQKTSSKIQPYTCKRIQSNFHDTTLTGQISSATAIRNELSTAAPSSIKASVPPYVYELLQSSYNKNYPMESDDLSLILKYKLLSLSAEQLESYLDVSSDLANRISKLKFSTHSFDELVDEIRSKQYTQTRIQRALLHILLDITNDDMKLYKENGITPYARILGLRKSTSNILRQNKGNENFTLITKLTKANLTAPANRMLTQDINAAHIYNLLVSNKYQTTPKDEYTQSLVLIP